MYITNIPAFTSKILNTYGTKADPYLYDLIKVVSDIPYGTNYEDFYSFDRDNFEEVWKRDVSEDFTELKKIIREFTSYNSITLTIKDIIWFDDGKDTHPDTIVLQNEDIPAKLYRGMNDYDDCCIAEYIFDNYGECCEFNHSVRVS